MDEAAGIVEPTANETSSRRRIDWRTGKQTLSHPRSFWEEHERRRVASDLSIAKYCEQHELARSTMRRWSARLQGRGMRTQQRSREAMAATSSTSFLPVAIVPARNDCTADTNANDARLRVEVLTRSGVRVRLFGEAADGVMHAVMAELAQPG